jgi:RNA-directed DNA polymerase
MSGPGDRAPKPLSPREPTQCIFGEGHGDATNSADRVASLPPGSKSSARSHMPSARKPGGLGGCLPQQCGGKSREGSEPYSAAHASEESDAVVVPTKSTKTWVTPVEPMEERTAAKGKLAARNTPPTLGGTSVLTAMQRVGQRVREKPKERLTNLLHYVKLPLLNEAFRRLHRNAAAGVDGVTWSEYEEKLDERLLALQDRVHSGRYHPLPVRRVHIAKSDGRTRPLGIPALEDKILQQAVRLVLEPIYEAMFLGFSYGFRRGRSQHDALDALAVAIGRRVNWVLDADIRSFFDSINHDWMKRFLEHRIADRRLVRLLMKWLHAGVLEDGVVRATEEGTPQGGIISPLLANIYLHYAFDLWVQQWRRRQARGDVYVVRYADDFIVCLQQEADARNLCEQLAHRLARFGLVLHPDKTRVMRFGRFACADKRESKPETFDFLGLTHICSTDRRGRFQLKRLTSRRKRNAKLASLAREIRHRRHEPVPMQHRWLLSVLGGHDRYYGVPTNYAALRSFHRAVEYHWHRWLQRRSQRARWSWRKRERFRVCFPLPAPRLAHPWPIDRFNAR